MGRTRSWCQHDLRADAPAAKSAETGRAVSEKRVAPPTGLKDRSGCFMPGLRALRWLAALNS